MSSHELTCHTAFWAAIDNYADTANAFEQKYKFDGNFPRELSKEKDPLSPAYPSLLVWPAMRDTDWLTHRQMKNEVTLEIRLYTKAWQFLEASDLIDKVRLACYSAPVASLDSYIKTATGFIPLKFGPIRYTPISVGNDNNVQALRTTAPLILQLRDDPLAR